MKPVLRYFGGKALIAKKIVSLMPPHAIYCEPFAGAATVLLNKPAVQTEIFNDIDKNVYHFFNVLRDEHLTHTLIDQILLTPFSREELLAAYEPTDDPVESARRMIVRSFQGYFAVGTTFGKTGFRVDLSGSAITTWQTIHKRLLLASQRMRNVVLENKPAIELIDLLVNNDKALLYIDPPYLLSTWNKLEAGDSYQYVMTNQEHKIMLEKITHSSVKANIMISGFDSQLYDAHLGRWTKHVFNVENRTHDAKHDCLWTNF